MKNIKKVELFPTKQKLTPITGRDWEDELFLAKLFKRPMRKFVQDMPTYPWLPPTPIIPKVNFDLCFNE